MAYSKRAKIVAVLTAICLTLVILLGAIYFAMFPRECVPIKVDRNDATEIALFFSKWRSANIADRKCYISGIFGKPDVPMGVNYPASDTLLGSSHRSEVEQLLGKPDIVVPTDVSRRYYEVPGYTTRTLRDRLNHQIVPVTPALYLKYAEDGEDPLLMKVGLKD
jgi:hypothetical protein